MSSLPWNKVNRSLLVFFLGTIHYFIWFPHLSPYLWLPQGNLCWDNLCSTGVAYAANARAYQKPPIIVSSQKICSWGHRPVRQPWLKATGAWAYHSVPSPSPPSLVCALPPFSSPSVSSPWSPPSPDRWSLPVASLGWTYSFLLSQLPWIDSWFLTDLYCRGFLAWVPGFLP